MNIVHIINVQLGNGIDQTIFFFVMYKTFVFEINKLSLPNSAF